MSLHLVRIVLRSGSMTELTYDTAEDAIDAITELRQAAAVRDHYGHIFTPETNQVAATVYVDLDAELRGLQIVLAQRMRMNAEAQRDAAGPQGGLVRAAPAPMLNGQSMLRG